ncbi:MAG: ROK family protein [candidate division NC10 bacterium]|nr:ROK family protein [candidate division NC10 bacterium]
MAASSPHGVLLGVDLGATTLAGGLVDAAGTVRNSRSVPTDRLGRGEGVLRNLLEVVAGLLDEARRLACPVLGAGVGAPGVIEVDTGTIGEDIQNIPEFRGLALGRIIRERTGLPVVVDNDVNALTLGEGTFGQARGLRHVAMIAVGTSIGGGLILNGALVRGDSGYGGEVGHTTVDLDGPDCVCGSRGCVKVYASGADIARQARSLLRADRTSILLELVGGDPNRIDAPQVFAAAAQGDPVAVTVVARAAQALGAGVGNLINLYNPELIVLGGSVMEAGEILMEPVVRWARFYAFEAAFDRTRIVRSTLTKESGVQGAAALFLYERSRGPLG